MAEDRPSAAGKTSFPMVNCHVHTFTHKHTPSRFLPWPVNALARLAVVRRLLYWLARVFDPKREGALGRYVEIIRTSYDRDQDAVFAELRGFYPTGTRFVVLPMDMTMMNAGPCEEPIATQHERLATLRDRNRELVIPFAAVDPRHSDVVQTTIRLIEEKGFRGLKLYPPTGYHPNDPRIRDLYTYAEDHDLPVLTHCSRPASVKYRGTPSPDMQVDPNTGEHLHLGTDALLTRFTDPDAYVPILAAHPRLRFCLAHFGGAGDWRAYIEKPWDFVPNSPDKSWLTKILEMIRSGDYPGLWTDIAYTLFADDDYVYLLKVLLEDEQIRSRVLFGSDFYVVESARLEERSRSLRLRAILGEDVFDEIARHNPRAWLGEIEITAR
jgi:predicted TIM-barrel fold metal-dependent hydrolase